VQFKCGLEQNTLSDLTLASKGRLMDVCGDCATQYGESEKCIISFSTQNWRKNAPIRDDVSNKEIKILYI
jgi:ribosome-binding protein aMBF1 (putative translation factor)